MEAAFYDRLEPDVRGYVDEIEGVDGLEVSIAIRAVRTDPQTGIPILQSCADTRVATIVTPDATYFPPASVFHEILHLHRFHVCGIPMLESADDFVGLREENSIHAVDNSLEHLSIVPIEVARYPARVEYWLARCRAATNEIVAGAYAQRFKSIAMYMRAFNALVLGDEAIGGRLDDIANRMELLPASEALNTAFRHAQGDKVATCVAFIRAEGLDPSLFRLRWLHPPRRTPVALP